MGLVWVGGGGGGGGGGGDGKTGKLQASRFWSHN